MRIKEIINTHRELGVKTLIEPSSELLAGTGTRHELEGQSSTDLAGTRHGKVARTRHVNVARLLKVKIYVFIILLLITIHDPRWPEQVPLCPP